MELVLTLAGIVAPGALLVAAVRRWLEPVSWRLAALLLLLTLAFLGRAVFTPDMPLPLDEVVRGYPYRGVVGEVEVKNPLVNETVRQILPWMQVSREALGKGEAPLWNPYSYSGYPLLGNGQSAPFSPFFVATLFVPLPKQVVAIAGLKLFVALLFGVLLLRREGAGLWAALLGAAYFGFSVFQTVWLFFPISAVTALFPGLLYALAKLRTEPSAAALVTLGLMTAAMQAGGHPESVAHAAMGAALFLLADLVSADGRHRLLAYGGWLALAVLAGTLLAAPAWLPLGEQALGSTRFAVASEHDMTRTLPLEGLGQMVNPDHFGNPARGNWNWSSNYAETAPSYLGLLPLALLLVPLFSSSATGRDRALVAAFVFVLLVAWNWTAVARLLNATPPLGWMANARLRFVATLFAAILAARSLDRFRRADVVPALTGTGIVVAGFVWAAWGRLPDTLTSAGAVGLIPVAGLWVALAIERRTATPRLAAWLAPLVVLELFVLNTPFNAITERRLYKPDLPIVTALKAHAEDGGLFRVVGHDWTLLPDGATWYGLEDIRGHDPMAFGPYLDFLDLVTTTEPRWRTKLVKRLPQPQLDYLNVRYVLTAPAQRLDASLRLLYEGPDGNLFENPRALPRFFAPRSWQPGGEAPAEALRRIDDYRQLVLVDEAAGRGTSRESGVEILESRQVHLGAFGLRVEATQRALIASSVPNPPGWVLSIDGRRQPIHTVNGAFIGFFVPAGESEVSLRYRPRSYTLGLVCCVLGLGVLGWIRFAVGARALDLRAGPVTGSRSSR